MKLFYKLLVITLGGNYLFYSLIHATIIARGDTLNAQTTFSTPITTKVFDIASGTLYFGLQSAVTLAGSTNPSALTKAIRSLGGTQPAFLTVAPGAITGPIEFLALATGRENQNPKVGFVTNTGTNLTQTTVQITAPHDSNTVATSASLNDANQLTTAGIVGIAAQTNFIFAAVKPNGNDFGTSNSGIAVAQIQNKSLALTVKDATTGATGNKAQSLDPSTSAIRINSDPTIVVNQVALHWDDILQRLYVGLQLSSGSNANDGAKSIVVCRICPAGKLDLQAIAPDAAFPGAGANRLLKMVGVQDSGGTSHELTVKQMRTLHASTGPSYLIINGGNGSAFTTGNAIFALPLVDNPSNITEHGTLADKTASLVNGKFTVTANSDATSPNSFEPAVLVGAGTLPFTADQSVSDMVTVGDAVYIARKEIQDNENDSGLWYSQALFDETGKIIRWTPWSKRAFPANAFSSCHFGIAFCDIDAVTGNIWAVDGETNTKVRLSAWSTGDMAEGLPAQLNILLPDCCSVLDLDQSTAGFTGMNAPQSRYALFGSSDQVIFARISQANAANPLLQTPQTVVTNFSAAINLDRQFLPAPGGSVRALEYARQSNGLATNYFFAGTEHGLFVFAQAGGGGFNEQTLGFFTSSPFSTGAWQKIERVEGAVIDIKTSGNKLYILATTSTPQEPFKSTLYSIPFATSTDAMFASPLTIIAQTNTSPLLSNTALFTGIHIISTNDVGSEEQLVLASNTGLYRSSRVGGVQGATSQADANWVLIDSSFYSGISGIDNAWHFLIGATDVTSRSTLWPISLEDEYHLGTFTRSSIHQLNGTTTAAPFLFSPTPFNSIARSSTAFITLARALFFWSDGGRRFFIANPSPGINNATRLMILPFDTVAWDIPNLTMQSLVDPLLARIKSFNWIQHIGMTGIILAGTNTGVVALE